MPKVTKTMLQKEGLTAWFGQGESHQAQALVQIEKVKLMPSSAAP